MGLSLKEMLDKIDRKCLVVEWTGMNGGKLGTIPGHVIRVKCKGGEPEQVDVGESESKLRRWDNKYGGITAKTGEDVLGQEVESILHLEFATKAEDDEDSHTVHISFCFKHEKPYYVIDVGGVNYVRVLKEIFMQLESGKSLDRSSTFAAAATVGTAGHGNGGGPIP